jgi:hypothetical protein
MLPSGASRRACESKDDGEIAAKKWSKYAYSINRAFGHPGDYRHRTHTGVKCWKSNRRCRRVVGAAGTGVDLCPLYRAGQGGGLVTKGRGW